MSEQSSLTELTPGGEVYQWPLHSSLPMLAVLAASEFERLLQVKLSQPKREKARESIKHLQAILRKPVEDMQAETEPKPYIDSMGAVMLANVYRKVDTDTPPRTYQELGRALAPIMGYLRRTAEGGDLEEHELKKAMKFCMVLSDEAAYTQRQYLRRRR